MNKTPLRILLIENNPAHAVMISRAFVSGSAPVKLTTVDSLGEARRSIARSAPDLAIVDLDLPDGEGLALLAPDDSGKRLPVVVTTSRANEQAVVQAMKAGALDYVVKSPITMADMPRIARRALREWNYLTERQEEEKTVRESEERHRRIFESVSDAILIFNANYAVVEANPAACRTYGYTREEFIRLHGWDLLPQSERHRIHECRDQVLRTNEFYVESVNIRKDGSLFDAEARASMLSFNGQPHLLTVLRDVTEWRKTTRELRDYSLALELTNEALGRSNEVAKAATRAKSEFLANMSHEIRTPMTAILGFVDVLIDNLDTHENIEAATMIKRNGKHLLTIINDILDLSKIEAGKLQVECIPCSVIEIVNDVATMMRIRTELPVTVECAAAIPDPIQTDPTRLRQILTNLVGNAVKFTEHGSIRIILTPLDLDTDDAKLQFDVIDTGIGMSEEHIAKLFEPFSQADSSMSRKFGGSGLGLVISQRLANMLKGDIMVTSRLGEGSAFRVTLPIGNVRNSQLISPPVGAATAASTPQTLGRACRFNGRVLLVEDGPDNQRLFSVILGKAGVEVTVAGNGQLALEHAVFEDGVFCELPFDLVLMDMQMPVMDGYEATRRLRALGHRGPIVALTAHAMAHDRRRCLEAGCDAYLAKPISREALLDAVAEHLAPVEVSCETRC